MTTFRSGRLAALAIATALLATGIVAGPASAAKKPAKCPAKKARKAGAKKCPAVKPKPKGTPFFKTIVTATILPGSHVTADIPSLPLPGGQKILGTPATVDIPMSGEIDGYITHRITIGKDIDVNFTHADFRLDPVSVLGDPACSNSPTLRINPGQHRKHRQDQDIARRPQLQRRLEGRGERDDPPGLRHPHRAGL